MRKVSLRKRRGSPQVKGPAALLFIILLISGMLGFSSGAHIASTVAVDVVVYSTQTSGLAAVRELTLRAPQLKVALVSSGNFFETPLAQGLSVEDARNINQVKGGFYHEWRQAVTSIYAAKGLRPYTASGRFVYEPEVATKALQQLVRTSTNGNVIFYAAKLVNASDQSETKYVDLRLEGGGRVRLQTRYFIDGSVEADLARMLGADYRVGRQETVYNDEQGIQPAFPSAVNNYATAPQRVSALLTLQIYSKKAPSIASLTHPNYNPSSYFSLAPLAAKNVSAFKKSWSMTIAVLPNNKRELNETWTDWPDVGLAFQWVFSPEKRGELRRQVVEWSINRVRYLQEHGYAQVGLVTIPQKLYVREGPRIVGLDTYTVADLKNGIARDTAALGCYVEYDRHDAFYPNHVEQTRVARLPMGALLARGHPWLVVSTAVSSDFAAYCSAVRMEHMRAAIGGAAGAIVGVADRLGVSAGEAPYWAVRNELQNSGYRLELVY